jgi:16S rRNA processing protein RimM
MPIEFLAVGRVLRPHGVRGELLLTSLTDFPEHLAEVKTVYLGEPPVAHPLVGARAHRGQLLLRLGDVSTREAADPLRGQLVQIRAQAAKPLPPGMYYQHQLIGLAVVTDGGEALGRLKEVLETGANDVYVVQGDGGELLLPAIKSVILQIDLPAQTMTVHLPAGLRDE